MWNKISPVSIQDNYLVLFLCNTSTSLLISYFEPVFTIHNKNSCFKVFEDSHTIISTGDHYHILLQ
jgi:hypothetical protein